MKETDEFDIETMPIQFLNDGVLLAQEVEKEEEVEDDTVTLQSVGEESIKEYNDNRNLKEDIQNLKAKFAKILWRRAISKWDKSETLREEALLWAQAIRMIID
ncbi:hypothetical protein FQA39_LY01733 [Lamprigera yunnana]|nr:hypothetical protein FQA39_LY01733 [Lamprigera yunnana]